MPDEPGKELARQEPIQHPQLSANRKLTTLNVDEMIRVATGFARSQVFKSGRQPLSMEELFVTIMAGQELGLGPAQAVMGISMIEGKPNMSANLQAALLKASGKYDYRAEWGYDESMVDAHGKPYPNPNWCEVTVISPDGTITYGTTRFTMADADRAGLLRPSKTGKPSNYLVYPRNMLFARTISNAVAFHAADSTMVRSYHEGEAPERDAEAQLAPPPPDDPGQTQLQEPRVEVPDEPEESIDAEDVEVQEVGLRVESPVQGEVLPGETASEAMARMVQEEAEGFDPATEPPPPVVKPPDPVDWTGEAAPTLPDPGELPPTEPTLTPGQLRLLHVKCGQAGFTDERRRQVLKEVTGEAHADRIPRRFMDALLERLNAEIQIAGGDNA